MRNSESASGLAGEEQSGRFASTSVSQPQPQTTSLSWDTRIQCFVGCFLLSIISSICANYLLLLTKLTGFCIMTSIGAVLSLSSTCFLMGPIGQIKKMFDSSRWLASVLYITLILATLIAGLLLKNAPLAVICTIGQYLAMAWYSLSYIPYARETVARVVCSCV
ncbi:unnamed protein product [Auanema sp. JU1783]|nr:unnamed protein product [Auanema sp. JU1783]